MREGFWTNFKIWRQKKKVRQAYSKFVDAQDRFSCGHSIAMNMPSYNAAFCLVVKEATKMQALDPTAPDIVSHLMKMVD